MTVEIILTDTPHASDRDMIAAGLRSYNEAQAGPLNAHPLAVLIRDREQVVGGLWGRTFYRWLYVELLFVPDALRGSGLGRQLMERAEGEARARGCIGAHLDTFGFQAPTFYMELGYAVFGQLDDFPVGQTRFFLQKAL
jgi:GNAT superfamily N-acetyltransferase